MKKIAALLLCVSTSLLAAEGYKIVHPDGSVEFSDTPVKGAEKIKLPDAQVYQSSEGKAAATGSAAPEKSKETLASYQRAAITAPIAEQTLNYDEAGFTVTVSTTPGLKVKEGHKVEVYVDGQLVASGATTSLRVKSMDRGAHVLSATIVDASGAHLLEAPAITFYVFQTSLIKQQGPTPGGGLSPAH